MISMVRGFYILFAKENFHKYTTPHLFHSMPFLCGARVQLVTERSPYKLCQTIWKAVQALCVWGYGYNISFAIKCSLLQIFLAKADTDRMEWAACVQLGRAVSIQRIIRKLIVQCSSLVCNFCQSTPGSVGFSNWVIVSQKKKVYFLHLRDKLVQILIRFCVMYFTDILLAYM